MSRSGERGTVSEDVPHFLTGISGAMMVIRNRLDLVERGGDIAKC